MCSSRRAAHVQAPHFAAAPVLAPHEQVLGARLAGLEALGERVDLVRVEAREETLALPADEEIVVAGEVAFVERQRLARRRNACRRQGPVGHALTARLATAWHRRAAAPFRPSFPQFPSVTTRMSAY